MNQKELKELIEFLKEQDIAEFELERGDVKVRIKRAIPASSGTDPQYFAVHPAPRSAPEVGAHPVIVPASSPTGPVSAGPAPTPSAASTENLHAVRSPIVGTYYESPSPGSPPFIKPGDKVELGQVLCIVEAMKLMNEIESDVAGELVSILVKNGEPIEYGQELFRIRPKS